MFWQYLIWKKSPMDTFLKILSMIRGREDDTLNRKRIFLGLRFYYCVEIFSARQACKDVKVWNWTQILREHEKTDYWPPLFASQHKALCWKRKEIIKALISVKWTDCTFQLFDLDLKNILNLECYGEFEKFWQKIGFSQFTHLFCKT